jgi:hypothetical protein
MRGIGITRDPAERVGQSRLSVDGASKR